MDILDQFDVSLFKLGSLCKRGHEYKNTGQTLRRIKGRACAECDRQKTRYEERRCHSCSCSISKFPCKRIFNGEEFFFCKNCIAVISQKTCFTCKKLLSRSEFRKEKGKQDGLEGSCRNCKMICRNSKKSKSSFLRISKRDNILTRFENTQELLEKGYYLGSLCSFSHDWKNTGYTLRYKNGHCVKCSSELSKYREWLKRGSEALSVAKLVGNAELHYQKYQAFKMNERARAKKRYKRFYQENKEKEKLRIKIWKHSNPNRTDLHNQRRIARVRSQSDGTVTKEQLKSILSANLCVYCDEKITEETATIDHIVPLCKGGLHSVFNLVACCSSCNASKKDRDFLDWIEHLTDKNKRKAMKLYVKRYGCEPQQQVLPLTFS